MVVPWQHEAVTEEDSPEGQNEEVVDVEDGEDTREFLCFSLCVVEAQGKL